MQRLKGAQHQPRWRPTTWRLHQQPRSPQSGKPPAHFRKRSHFARKRHAESNGICWSQPETVGNAALRWQLGSRRCRELQLVLSTQPATSCHTHATAGPGAYERHCPETTLLYRTIQEHWATFVADLEAGGGELPAFVLDELEAYLRCGILVHGLLRVRCKDCGHSRVVVFACKRRGFCPS